MTHSMVISLTLSVLAADIYAVSIPESVKEVCSTNERIYYETEIRSSADLNRPAKDAAVARALGSSKSNPNFSTKTFNGQWFYEFQNDDAVFAGYKVRAHYLSTAIVFTDLGVTTIICNSANLNQKEGSIHRKAPLWKGTLDSNLRIELGKASAIGARLNRTETSLQYLLKKGVISQPEYEEIRSRPSSE